MMRAFSQMDHRMDALFLPAPPVGWWAPLFGTLQAMCWRSVGGL